MERSSVIKEAAEQKEWHTHGQVLESQSRDGERHRDGGMEETGRQRDRAEARLRDGENPK